MSAVFLACLSAGAAHAQGWVQVRSPNFFVIGDAGERQVRQTAERLEQFRETIRLMFPQIKVDGGVRTNVVVFRDAASYAPFKLRRQDGEVDTGVAGYFQSGEDVNYITLSVGDKAAGNGTVLHEYVHFLLDANIGRSDLPPWLGEGLAEYFETVKVMDDGRISLGAPPPGHLDLLRKNELIPLKEFLATDSSALHARGDESRSLFYAQAWAAAHYLLHANTPGGTRLEHILSEAKAATGAADTSVRLFGSNPEALAKTLREYISAQTIPTRAVQVSGRQAVPYQISSGPLAEAQTAAYLGDLLFRTGRTSEAETWLGKALRLDAEQPVANLSMGLLLVRKREFAGAKKHLERGIAADRTNHYAHFSYAYALSQESMDENGTISEFPAPAAAKMRDALRRSIELNPNFAESYRLLGFISLVNDTDLEEAAAILNRGLAAKPGDEHLRLVLAQVLLRQERYSEAGTIAEKLAAGTSEAEIWAGARSVMHTVEQYRAASTVETKSDTSDPASFGPLPPLILKRSTLSESDVARYEDEVRINNLNILVDKPRFGEKQAVGFIEKITCADGAINYTVRSGSDKFELASVGFASVRLKVLTEGERSFTLDCGANLSQTRTVLTFEPKAADRPGVRGRLLSIAFVPDFFRLKTSQEMANWRTVIIEDDRMFKSRSTAASRP